MSLFDFDRPAPTPDATPSATVVPLRDGGEGLEVLLLRRSQRGAFAGTWVFPGGQVDDQDLPAHPAAGDEVAAARLAAVREAAEEAALDLDPASLVTLSFWLAPPEAKRRFATWYFVAPVGAVQQVVVDRAEIHEHMWVAPARAMEMRQSGLIELSPPTFVTLWWLARHPDSASVLDAARSGAPERYESHVVGDGRGQGMAIMWAGDAGYHDGDLGRPGRRRRLLMESGGWRMEVSPAEAGG